MKKNQRRAVKDLQQPDRFEDYIEQAVDSYGLPGEASVHKEDLMELHRLHQHQLDGIETLIILQVNGSFFCTNRSADGSTMVRRRFWCSR